MSAAPERDSAEQLARRIAKLADEKGASEIVALDVRPLVGYTDFLVIVTARNERQAAALHGDIRKRLKDEGQLPGRVEGSEESQWVVLDYLDAVLHIFTRETRERYRLETLWGEAAKLDLPVRDAS
ncbi:MAG: ribosome silencing factor [Solirubrobacterales bacterium]